MSRLVADKKTFLEILDDLSGLKEYWVESDNTSGLLKIELNEEALLTKAESIGSNFAIGIIMNVYSIWIVLLNDYAECIDNCDHMVKELSRLQSLTKPV